MNNLKSTLKLAILFFFISQTNVDAATVIATSNGYWYNNIWSVPAGPQPGDDIVIPTGVKVYMNTMIDLTTPGNNTPTNIHIDGELIFLDAAIFCMYDCEVGLKLDSGSVITVDNAGGISESETGGSAAQNIYFGGTLVELSFPFGPGTVSSEGMILPVDLIAFEGNVLSRSNELKWVTASEENTSHFIIERSSNGFDDYKEIGRVEAEGNTTDLQTYFFNDMDRENMSYYRLKIVDLDESKTFSSIIILEHAKETFEVEVYPNPVIEDVNVTVNLKEAGPVEIKIFEPSGKVIQNDIFDLNAGKNKVIFEMNGSKHQMYFINISYGNTVVSKKIMVTK